MDQRKFQSKPVGQVSAVRLVTKCQSMSQDTSLEESGLSIYLVTRLLLLVHLGVFAVAVLSHGVYRHLKLRHFL